MGKRHKVVLFLALGTFYSRWEGGQPLGPRFRALPTKS
jgi:hypothetical protein